MPETYTEFVNRVLRDHEGYTGDGLGGVGELPVGDRSTARKPLDKRDIRAVVLAQESAVSVAVQAATDATAAKDAAAISAASATGTPQYATRAAAEAATVPAFADQILVDGILYQKDAAGTALTTAGGVTWSPAGEASVLHYLDGSGNAQPAFSAAVQGGGDVHLPARDYPISGNLDTVSGLALRSAQGAVFKPFGKSATGGFVTNVTQDAGTRAQSGIWLDNLQLDGINYPAPYYTTASSGTTTTVTLPAGASAADGAYTGQILQFMSGSLIGQYRTITGYAGATRTATLASAFGSAPAAGDAVAIGFNDNATGWAWGVENLQFNGGLIRNLPSNLMVPFGQGAKNVNLEQGVQGASGRIPDSENMGTHFFIQGKPGLIGSVPASVTMVALQLGHAENVGSFISVLNSDGVAGVSPGVDEVSAVLTGGSYHNAGHNPWRIVTSNQQKSGIINLGGANGVTISNVRGYNDVGYPTSYPTDYAGRVGYGLTGPVGALIWGHARNSSLRNIAHGGDLDCVVHVGRCRAIGDDATPNGYVTQMRAWDMSGIRVSGIVGQVVRRDDAFPVSGAEITGHWEISVEACTGNLVPPQWTNGATLVLDITETSSGRRIIGTPAQIIAYGNTMASYSVGTTDLRAVSRRTKVMGDDTAFSFAPRASIGTLAIATTSGLAVGGHVFYRATSSPAAKSSTADITATTGALSGTTGVNGSLTVSAADGVIYIENRLGGSVTVVVADI